MSRIIVVLACCVLAAIAQKPARIGPDGKPLLNRPDLELCKKSKLNCRCSFELQNVIDYLS